MKVAVIGLGNAAWKYDIERPELRRSHCQSIIELSEFKLTAGVDLDVVCGDAWALHFGLPVYLSIEELLQKHNLDLIILSVPISDLFENLIKLVDLTMNTVILVEKPVLTSIAEFELVSSLITKFEGRVIVNLPRLFAPETFILRDIVAQLPIKKLEIEGTYSGSPENTALHFVALLNFLFPEIRWERISQNNFHISKLWGDELIEIGSMKCESTTHISNFGFRLFSEGFEIRYTDGGNIIEITKENRSWQLASTRNRYQLNVYEYLCNQGLTKTNQIGGLAQILPSIRDMLGNDEKT